MRKNKKIKGIIFDMGDTLVKEYHEGEEIPERPFVFPHVKEVLGRLKKRFKLAIVSNTLTATEKHLKDVLKEAKLESYFEFVIASADNGIHKPDPRIYEAALEKLKLKPNEVIMVGNRISSDILGANQLGIISILIWFKDYDHHPDDKIPTNDLEEPIATVHSFLELEQVINKITTITNESLLLEKEQ